VEADQSTAQAQWRVVADTLGALEERAERAPELAWIGEASLTEALNYES
jgi:hypothetical protein